MEGVVMNVSSVSSQLDAIIAGSAPATSSPKPAPAAPAVSELSIARAEGREREYLEEQVSAINGVVDEMGAPVRFDVEVSEVGDFFVRVVNEQGEQIKTIPTETLVHTRERIRAEVKGLIEDSQN
jgi:uncharacterized FlaG/YvyC family protein